MMLWPAPPSRSSSTPGVQGTAQYPLSQQQTLPQPVVPAPSNSVNPVDPPLPGQEQDRAKLRRRYVRIFAIAVIIALTITLYFIWNSSTAPTSSPSISQQNFNSTSASGNGSSNNSPVSDSGGDIKVYVVGAVKHPGVYTLPPDARVSDLLQAAGGPLSDANLVALNLAAKLSDGQEVYVIAVGETPPTYSGGVPGPGAGTASAGNTATGSLVNINTATVDEMRQNLHVSSTTAQNIVNYRTQHGPFTSVDQLLQVVSKSIYDKIKDLVTI